MNRNTTRPHLQATTIPPENEYKNKHFGLLCIFMLTQKNNKIQRHPHFTDSPPRFINEMEK